MFLFWSRTHFNVLTSLSAIGSFDPCEVVGGAGYICFPTFVMNFFISPSRWIASWEFFALISSNWPKRSPTSAPNCVVASSKNSVDEAEEAEEVDCVDRVDADVDGADVDGADDLGFRCVTEMEEWRKK